VKGASAPNSTESIQELRAQTYGQQVDRDQLSTPGPSAAVFTRTQLREVGYLTFLGAFLGVVIGLLVSLTLDKYKMETLDDYQSRTNKKCAKECFTNPYCRSKSNSENSVHYMLIGALFGLAIMVTGYSLFVLYTNLGFMSKSARGARALANVDTRQSLEKILSPSDARKVMSDASMKATLS
jgi:hypothetical protein